jgi:hypothetical protein
MEKISAFIIACDEADKIEAALLSVAFCDEVVVVDSGSVDETVSIAERMGARVISHPWQGYAKQKQFALEQCQYDWCINIDADERVTPALRDAIEGVLRHPGSPVAYALTGRNYFLGAMVPMQMRLERHVRLFRSHAVRYTTDKLVHERVVVQGPVAKLPGYIAHESKETIAVFQQDIEAYSTLRAVEKKANNRRPSLGKLSLILPLTFLKKYVLQRACFFGVRGFILAMMEAYYAFLKEAKLWEQYHNPHAESES